MQSRILFFAILASLRETVFSLGDTADFSQSRKDAKETAKRTSRVLPKRVLLRDLLFAFSAPLRETSLLPQRAHRIQSSRAPSRHIPCGRSESHQHRRGARQQRIIGPAESEQHRAQHPRSRNRPRRAQKRPREHEQPRHRASSSATPPPFPRPKPAVSRFPACAAAPNTRSPRKPRPPSVQAPAHRNTRTATPAFFHC